MSPEPHPADRQVDALADRYVEQWAEVDPLGATGAGIAGHDAEMTDLSPDGVVARQQLLRDTLEALAPTEPVDDREAVAKAAMTERLGLQLERHEAGLADIELSVLTSGLHEVREVFDLMDTDGEQAVAAIDARLAAVPVALAGWRQTMRVAAGEGRVPARRQVLGAADQARGWTGARPGGGGDDIFADLAAGLATSPGSQRDQLERHAAGARAALGETADFLIHELAPLARETDAVGRETYELESRYFLGATVDLDETYAWGWAELHRIAEERAAAARRIVPGGSYADAVETLDAEPGRWVAGGAAFRDWMQTKADAAIDDLAGVHFDIPDPVRRVQCLLARPTTASSTTPARARTSAGRAGCGGRCPTASPTSRRGES